MSHSGGGGKVVLFGLVGLGAWWVYENFFKAAGSVPSTVTPGLPIAPASAGSGAPASYTGPNLDAMYTALAGAVNAAYTSGSDPALSCAAAGVSGLGAGSLSRLPGGGGFVGPTLLGSRAGVSAPAGSPVSATCQSVQATYDVFNWYLVNRANVGIAKAPDPPDHTTALTLAQYWAWAAPLLQQQVPGLSGLGFAGLGHYGAIARIVRGE